MHVDTERMLRTSESPVLFGVLSLDPTLEAEPVGGPLFQEG